jgi:hypothetical protein
MNDFSATSSVGPVFAAGPVSFALTRPLTIIDRQVHELTFREPTGKDLRELGRYQDNATDYTLRLAERLAGIPTGSLDSVSGRDAVRIGAVIKGFLADDEA